MAFAATEAIRTGSFRKGRVGDEGEVDGDRGADGAGADGLRRVRVRRGVRPGRVRPVAGGHSARDCRPARQCWRARRRRRACDCRRASDQRSAPAAPAVPPAPTIPTGAALGGVLGGPVGASLADADREAAWRAQIAALDSGKPRSWRGGHGVFGSVEPGAETGAGCRAYAQTIYVAGRPNRGQGVACRQPEGGWKMTS